MAVSTIIAKIFVFFLFVFLFLFLTFSIIYIGQTKSSCFRFAFCFRFAVVLAFDVKIERDAQEFADKEGVRIFSAEIIYHLFDQFTAYCEVIFFI